MRAVRIHDLSGPAGLRVDEVPSPEVRAGQVRIDVRACGVKLPDGVGFEVGAATLLTYATTYHALVDRAAIQPKESLLVLGAAGGVGIAAVELGALLGARVIAAASSAEKLAFCREHGASDTIDYAREDFKERVKAIGGV